MFSIIIPLYNKEKSIINTLNSIIAQSYTTFEIIVVDDGSTDNSVEAVLSVSDKRINLIKKSNGGVCSARNRGIQEAKYPYIALLDADDYWDKDYLLEQTKMIADFPNATLWGINFAEVTDGNKLIRKLPTGLIEGYRGYVENYFNMSDRISDLFCSSSVVIRKDIFTITGMFDERLKYSEDIDMWYRIIANFPVAFYDRYMSFYQYDAENRAMNRKRTLRYFLPYYSDKYLPYKNNSVFYNFIIRWCAVNIKDIYFNDKSQRNDAKVAAKKLDFSVLPSKYKYLFNMPYCISYSLYLITEYRLKLKNK